MQINKATLLKTGLLYLFAAILITLSYPTRVVFKYDYTVGSPWQYELLTAPFEFKIEKPDRNIQIEKDSITRHTAPYFKIRSEVYLEQKNRLLTSYNESAGNQRPNSEQMSSLMRKLEEVYQIGIISPEDLQRIQESADSTSYLIDEHKIAHKIDPSTLLTPAEAYQEVIKRTPREQDRLALRALNVSVYLKPNYVYDNLTTEKVKQSKLADINTIIGQVQAGERIVSNGEIITDQMYQVLESLKREFEKRTRSQSELLLIRLGQFMLTASFIALLYFFLLSFRPTILADVKNSVFILTLIVFFCILTLVTATYDLFSVYIIPYAMVPMLIRIFMDSRTAFFSHLVMILICTMVVQNQVEFFIIQFVAAAVAILTLSTLNQRSDLIRSTFATFISLVFVYFCYTTFHSGSFTNFSWLTVLYLAINMVFLMFTYVFVYIIEKTFGYISNISLVELTDTNSPLLRSLSEKASGTFQHSLQVSILAEEATAKIGGDTRLVRAGALYHDIGKMRNPSYFTENQGSVNPHDQLTYDESAKIIIKHVTDGIKMAEKAKLPQSIIDFIRTHHGLGQVKYFYNMYKNTKSTEIIDESVFRYPGPNPFTKEQAVLMLADGVEASSRSLREFSEEALRTQIDKIVDSVIDDGLLKNSPLTFRDVEVIKGIFLDKLLTIYHTRIQYPELKQEKQKLAKPEQNTTSTS